MAKEGLLEDLQMPKSRRLILMALKEYDGLTADELAEMLNISAVAVRRHLDTLSNSGLVRHEEVQRGMGRPSFVYSLGKKADHIFPRNYEGLAREVIDMVRDLYGPEAVDAIFEERVNRIINLYKPHVNAKTLPDRLTQLTQLRTEDGYMASWSKNSDGAYIFTESNCPIHNVAESCGQACQGDLALFTALLEVQVSRRNHMMEGDSTCSYVIELTD